MRPLDRQEILDAVESRLDDREPTLVVATQCVEAGVDWDFDAMISESASWDALVQRMGRVNRRGERTDASCIVLQADRSFKDPETDEQSCPVYRRYEIETAEWLARVSELRCSPGAMPDPPEGCVRPPVSAPLLLAEYLDLWSQNRADGPEYDVSVFLHGVRQDYQAHVIWRDLDPATDRAFLEPLLKAVPPSSLEAAAVPLRALREWLRKRKVIRLGAEIEIETAENIKVGAVGPERGREVRLCPLPSPRTNRGPFCRTGLNKLSADQREELLLSAGGPFRSLVVALLSSGGRSEMDFVSGGRSGFKSIFEWSTTAQAKAFSPDELRRALVGPRALAKGGKSFRWSPLAAQGARRPQSASNDKRCEPWIEWLALMGVSALVSVPEVRAGRLATRSTAVYGYRWNSKQFRWPLWNVALAWPDASAALAGNRYSLRDARWCEAERLAFGPDRNRTYGFGPGQPCWK